MNKMVVVECRCPSCYFGANCPKICLLGSCFVMVYKKRVRMSVPKATYEILFILLRLEIDKRAREAGLSIFIVLDAGRTQIASGSKTVLAIGPGKSYICS